MYVNIHTHKHWEQRADTLHLVNVLAHATPDEDYPLPCSIGIHPWYIPVSTPAQAVLFQTVDEFARRPTTYAIGEIGLDKGSAISFDVQLFVLKKQLRLALEHGLPVIVHCVGRFEELLQCLKNEHFNNPVLIHGFVRKPELALRLCAAGCYLSFGAALLDPGRYPGAAESLRRLPRERILLETDDAPVSIECIYGEASRILGCSLSELQILCKENAERFFQFSIFNSPS